MRHKKTQALIDLNKDRYINYPTQPIDILIHLDYSSLESGDTNKHKQHMRRMKNYKVIDINKHRDISYRKNG